MTLLAQLVLIAIGVVAAAAVPNRLAEELRFEVAWITELDYESAASSTMWASMLLEQQDLLPVWHEPVLMYLHPMDGHIVDRNEYASGAAFTERLQSSAVTEDGAAQVRSAAGKLLFSLSGSGRVVLRPGMNFIVSPYLNEIRGFSRRGDYLWKKQLADILTVVESVQNYAVVGTVNGELQLISPEGEQQSVRAADGNPILAVASRDRTFWVVVDGETLLLERRTIDDPNNPEDAILLPGQGPLRRNIQLRVGFDTLYLPDYELLLLGDDEIIQLPSGTDYYDIPGGDLSLNTAETVLDGYQQLSLKDYRNGLYATGTASAEISIQPRESGFLLWDDQWAVFYRLRRKADG